MSQHSTSGLEQRSGDGDRTTDPIEGLDRAVSAWNEKGDPRPLARWLDRGLDRDGIPVKLSVGAWRALLARLAEARDGRRGEWPDSFDARVEGLFRSVLRFARPDGSAVFGPTGRDPRTGRLFRDWAGRLTDGGLATVVDWWFPGRSNPRDHAPPPLPAYAQPDQPLAMLRADWSKAGDLVAVDHRLTGPSCRLELVGLGRPWLGSSWSADPSVDSTSRGRVRLWVSNPAADLLEWSFRAGKARITRTALLLRGRRLAILADEAGGTDGVAGMRLELPESVEPRPIEHSRGLVLTGSGPGRGACQVLPIGLPGLPYATERGSFEAGPSSLRLAQRIEGRRGWLPLLASWDPIRNRKPVRWRLLTVSENSKACAPDVAFAVRVTWGRDETLVIYRSLSRPALRAFLGHQTRARFLVGVFDGTGKLVPIVALDD